MNKEVSGWARPFQRAFDGGRDAAVWVHDGFLRSIHTIRHQIDRTGLFPELHGEPGQRLRQQVRDDGALSKAYMLMAALSAGIATLGLLQSSTAVVIGAMLISPMMGPIAAMGFSFASLDGHHIRDSLRVVAVGAIIGIVTGVVLTWLSPIRNATPEIIARTEPTLLDLAVAIFSGVAGAYATVQQKGATAIGVAIATALMPPLAVIGYGIGTFNLRFAMGATLLFLTNLAAIAFSFALVARFSGAARPFANVELTPRYIVAGLAGFLLLAMPLGITLYRVTNEAKALSVTRGALAEEFGVAGANIAQLDVKWPFNGQPSVNAVIVTSRYDPRGQQKLAGLLADRFGTVPDVKLQQVVAADIGAQTRAIVDAAIERSTAGVARDVPPLTDIRRALGLPALSLWADRANRTVSIMPFAAPDWTLADYRAMEQRADRAGGDWRVNVIPPVQQRISLPVEADEDGNLSVPADLDLVKWAVERWGLLQVAMEPRAVGALSDDQRRQTLALAQSLATRLEKMGVKARVSLPAREEGAGDAAPAPEERFVTAVDIVIVGPPPSAAASAPADGPALTARPVNPVP